jgi:hypothetical protein
MMHLGQPPRGVGASALRGAARGGGGGAHHGIRSGATPPMMTLMVVTNVLRSLSVPGVLNSSRSMQ